MLACDVPWQFRLQTLGHLLRRAASPQHASSPLRTPGSPQSGSYGGWVKSEGSVKSEGWVACSARKPRNAPTVRATARSTATRRFSRIRTGACRRGRPVPGLRARRPPNPSDPMPDQTACRQSTTGERKGAGNDVARTSTPGGRLSLTSFDHRTAGGGRLSLSRNSHEG